MPLPCHPSFFPYPNNIRRGVKIMNLFLCSYLQPLYVIPRLPAGPPRNRDSIPCRRKRLFSLPNHSYWLWGSPLDNVCRGVLCAGAKRSGIEIDYSLASSAKVKNAWSYTSPSAYVFMKCTEKLSLYLHINSVHSK